MILTQLIDVLAQADFGDTPATAPPGSAGFLEIMQWVKWGGYAVAFVGILMIGAMFAISHRRGQASEHAGSLGSWGFGVFLIGAAGPILNALMT